MCVCGARALWLCQSAKLVRAWLLRFIILEYGACGEPDRGLARHAPLRSDLISFKVRSSCSLYIYARVFHGNHNQCNHSLTLVDCVFVILVHKQLLDTCVAALAYFTLGFNVFTTNKFDVSTATVTVIAIATAAHMEGNLLALLAPPQTHSLPQWLKAMFGTMPEDATFLDTTGLTWMLHYGFAQDTATVRAGAGRGSCFPRLPLTTHPLPDTSLTQIVTGAVIGRIDVRGYLLGTFLIVAILQPLVARWVWTT